MKGRKTMFDPFRTVKKNVAVAVELAQLYPSDENKGYFKSAEAFCKMMIGSWIGVFGLWYLCSHM